MRTGPCRVPWWGSIATSGKRLREADVPLAAAEHPLDAFLRVPLVRQLDRQQHLGVLGRILHPHAAVAVGTLLVSEQMFVRRVVLVNEELVGEVETDAPERVTGAGRLIDAH